MCDLRRQLKKTKHEPGSKYKTINTQIKRDMKKAKENWIKQKLSRIRKLSKQEQFKESIPNR